MHLKKHLRLSDCTYKEDHTASHRRLSKQARLAYSSVFSIRVNVTWKITRYVTRCTCNDTSSPETITPMSFKAGGACSRPTETSFCSPTPRQRSAHVVKEARGKLAKLGWDMVPNPISIFALTLASDYRLFRPLKALVAKNNFNKLKMLKGQSTNYFTLSFLSFGRND